MRVANIDRHKGAVNLTSGKIRRLVPVYMGSNLGAQSYYYLRAYNRKYKIEAGDFLGIKRK